MRAYIIRRLVQAVLVIVIISLLIFLVLRLMPGDPILMLMSVEQLTQISDQEIELMRHEHGLDRSLMVQYSSWIGEIFRGDFGHSIVENEPVTRELFRRLPITLHLGLVSLVISILVGVPAGVISAVRRGRLLDTVVTLLANVGITIPVFWLGIMMIYLIGLKLGWLPMYGYTSPLEDFWQSTRQAIMPVICLAVFPLASNARQARSAMLEVMRQDYIRTAWAKGLRERVIIIRHALKNGLIPIVTLIGLGFRFIVGGQVLVETVFNIPGMGRMAVNGVLGHDYPVVQGVVLVIAVVIVLANLAVDISYGWLDPRIRYG